MLISKLRHNVLCSSLQGCWKWADEGHTASQKHQNRACTPEYYGFRPWVQATKSTKLRDLLFKHNVSRGAATWLHGAARQLMEEWIRLSISMRGICLQVV